MRIGGGGAAAVATVAPFMVAVGLHIQTRPRSTINHQSALSSTHQLSFPPRMAAAMVDDDDEAASLDIEYESKQNRLTTTRKHTSASHHNIA